MSPRSISVAVRRLLVRRPWIYWSFVVVAVLGMASTTADRAGRVDAARESWGSTRSVWVARVDHRPGDALDVESAAVPSAMIAATASVDIAGGVARQHISAGEIIHDIDLVANAGPQSRTPPGWLAVPVVESPPSGASLGDRVEVVSDGYVVSAQGLVVGHHADATLVAVPHDVAPLLPAADQLASVTLLLVP